MGEQFLDTRTTIHIRKKLIKLPLSATDGKKTFANPVSEKFLISRIHKELSKITEYKQSNLKIGKKKNHDEPFH